MNAFADDLVIGDGSNSNGITIYTGTNDNGTVNFADGSSGSPSYQGYIQYNHTTNQFSFFADYATNGGTPRIVSNTTAAPIIPVEAASKTPINTIEIASPPLVLPNNFDRSVIKSSAMPDLSIMIPIKINIGNATKTQLAITP